jgi:DNA-binding winged helix-turn-helix (wHTH) protein
MKHFQSFGLDTSNQCLLHNGAQIDLTPKLFAVLRYLVENPGRLVTHDELLEALWPETYVQPQVLRTYVLELRKVLGDDAAQPRFIQTLPKRGYRFVAPVIDRSEAPLPIKELVAQDPGAAPIIGRDDELKFLNTQADLLGNGQRRVVFVTGDAGIGKTALVDSFCRHIAISIGASVGRGQSVNCFGAAEEYYPVTEALGQLVSGPCGQALRRILARRAPAWLEPGQNDEASDLAAPGLAVQERTIGDLCAALEEMAAERRLILIFEDLHWADQSTLNLISTLARRRGHAHLMVVATSCPRRGLHVESLKGLQQDLLMRRLCAELPLAPLRKNSVRALLSRELDQDVLPPELPDFVFQRSEGNPLFVIAFIEHLIAQGVLVRRGENGQARWEQCLPFPGIEDGVPDPLARMIEMEIDCLCEEDQRVLEAASLMTFAFPVWAVAAALGKDSVEIEDACDSLARRLHYVVRAGEDELLDGTRSAFYVFRHGLYREFLYQRQPAARRAQGHIRIAERLGKLFAGREVNVAREIAMHFKAAGEPGRAAFALESLGRLASQGVC